MKIFEKIPQNEVKMIEAYIDEYALENSSRSASADHLLRIWDEAKSAYLYRMLGDQFVISKPIEFIKDVEELESDLDEALYSYNADEDVLTFINDFRDKVLANIEKVYNWDLYDSIRVLISSWALAKNIYEGKTCELITPSGKSIKIQNGAKITRMLGKIAAEYELRYFEKFRIVHSQVLNQKKLKGTLCLSIHPLDYMTMSDNASGWSSCMSWEENGCYRQGTVEMMNSPMVVVAYLRGSEDMAMPGVNEDGKWGCRWVNKKWRQLFIITPELITNVKAYPYRNDYLTYEVLKWLKSLAEKANIGEYTKDIIQYGVCSKFIVKELNNRVCYISPATNRMYNDFSSNQFAYIGKSIPEGNYLFSYSGKSECMACGSTCCEFDSEGMLAGDCCESTYYCECCEGRYYNADDFIEVDGMYICPNCYDDHCYEDAITGEVHHEDNMIRLFLAVDENRYCDCVSVMLHCDTFEPSMLTNYFNAVHKSYEGYYSVVYYVNLSDCTEEGIKLFGYRDRKDAEEDLKETPWTRFLAAATEEIAKSWIDLLDRWTSQDRLRLAFQIAN